MEKVTSQTSYQNIKSDGWKALTTAHDLKHSSVCIVALSDSDTQVVLDISSKERLSNDGLVDRGY